MLFNQLGYYSLVFGLFFSIFLIPVAYKDLKNSNYFINSNIFSIVSLQLFSVIISFFCLIISFVNSDFGNEIVYNNSHTSKPLFYKISGSWGNHEGSMLLWCWVMSLYGFFVTLNFQRISSDFKTKILMFQGILCFGFIVFLKFKSNPFEKLFPIPEEDLEGASMLREKSPAGSSGTS